MAVSISISITQNSQSIANNTSNITVNVNASWSGGSFNRTSKSGWLKIDGTTYDFTSSFNANQSSSGSQTLFTKTVNVSHNNNGAKTVSCSASYTTGVSSGTVTASASKTLTTIPRASSMSIPNGTLGSAVTISVTKKDSSFKHRIYYVLNGTTTYIAGSSSTYSTSTSISWTPPLSFASKNTTGTSVTIWVNIATYTSSGTLVDDSTSKTVTMSIPASVKPTCNLTVSESTNYSSTYGGYVQGISKLSISVTGTPSYGSPIASYSVSANGASYNTSSVTTGVLTKSGSNTISAKVKDKRGRSGSASKSITVLAYEKPAVTKLAVRRCNQNGTENIQGEYAKVTFSSKISALSNKNSATYFIRYRKTTSTSLTMATLSAVSGNYAVADYSYIFAADSGSSYYVEIEAKDNFGSHKKSTNVSTAFALIHWNSSGTGIAFGKVSEDDTLFDVGLPARFNSSVQGMVRGLGALPVIPDNANLNNYTTPQMVCITGNDSAETIKNIPIKKAGTIEIYSSNGKEIKNDTTYYYIRQHYRPYDLDYPEYVRWGETQGTSTWTFGAWQKTTHGTTEACYWIHGRRDAMISAKNSPDSMSAYHPFASVKSYSGAWTTGTYNNEYRISYTADSDYNSNTNAAVQALILSSDGKIQTNGVTINRSGYDMYYNVQNGTYNLSFGMGAGGVNRGIYDHTRGHWVIHNNASDTYVSSTGKIILRPLSSTGNGNIVLSNASSKPSIVPSANNGGYVGDSYFRFTTFYCVNAVNVSSDRRLKKDISEDFTKLDTFFNKLKPVSYRLKDDTDGKLHMGFIAQDVEQALIESEIDADGFAFLAKDELDIDSNLAEELNDDISYGLGYTEMIPLNTYKIQKLDKIIAKQKETITEQQNKINNLESRLSKLEALLNVE